MDKNALIKVIAQKTNISEEQATSVSNVLESNNLLTKEGREKAVNDIATTLKIDPAAAKKILDTASDAIKGGILDKIKMPFGSDKK